MYGIGNNHQFFIIAFQLLESILTKIAGVSFFSMNEQHGTADFIGIRLSLIHISEPTALRISSAYARIGALRNARLEVLFQPKPELMERG